MPLETKVEEERDLIQLIQLYKEIIRLQESFLEEIGEGSTHSTVAKVAAGSAVFFGISFFSSGLIPVAAGILRVVSGGAALATMAGAYAISEASISNACQNLVTNTNNLYLALTRPESFMMRLKAKLELFNSKGIPHSNALCYLISSIKEKQQWNLIDENTIRALEVKKTTIPTGMDDNVFQMLSKFFFEEFKTTSFQAYENFEKVEDSEDCKVALLKSPSTSNLQQIMEKSNRDKCIAHVKESIEKLNIKLSACECLLSVFEIVGVS